VSPIDRFAYASERRIHGKVCATAHSGSPTQLFEWLRLQRKNPQRGFYGLVVAYAFRWAPSNTSGTRLVRLRQKEPAARRAAQCLVLA
jgi:hypothetical protein